MEVSDCIGTLFIYLFPFYILHQCIFEIFADDIKNTFQINLLGNFRKVIKTGDIL